MSDQPDTPNWPFDAEKNIKRRDMSTGPEARLEEYLDRVCAEFWYLPPEDLQRNRTELRSHLDDVVAARVAQGLDEASAIDQAIAEFGPARKIGRQIARATQTDWLWKPDSSTGRPNWITRYGGYPRWVSQTGLAVTLTRFVLVALAGLPGFNSAALFGFALAGIGGGAWSAAAGTIRSAFNQDYEHNARMVQRAIGLPGPNRLAYRAKAMLKTVLVSVRSNDAASLRKTANQRRSDAVWNLIWFPIYFWLLIPPGYYAHLHWPLSTVPYFVAITCGESIGAWAFVEIVLSARRTAQRQ